jgi:DnaK suppressor protein
MGVTSFGLFLSLSVLLGFFLMWKQARRLALPEERAFDVLILGLFFAAVTSRIVFVFLHPAVFASDWARLFFFWRYPGFSLPAALAGGAGGVVLSAAVFRLDWRQVLDVLAAAFSWAVLPAVFGGLLSGSFVLADPRGVIFVAVLVILASVGTLLGRVIRNSPEYLELARKPGWFFSCYLIFFSLSFLILMAEDEGFYFALFLGAALFFLGRYRRELKMIKFPTDVLAQITGYLEQRRREIERKLKELKKEDPFEDKSRLLDRASDDTEAQSKAGHERVAAMQRQLTLALVQTRKALTKIKIGKYGICESCGKMIDTDRLAAMPAATLCLSCEKKREK